MAEEAETFLGVLRKDGTYTRFPQDLDALEERVRKLEQFVESFNKFAELMAEALSQKIEQKSKEQEMR